MILVVECGSNGGCRSTQLESVSCAQTEPRIGSKRRRRHILSIVSSDVTSPATPAAGSRNSTHPGTGLTQQSAGNSSNTHDVATPRVPRIIVLTVRHLRTVVYTQHACITCPYSGRCVFIAVSSRELLMSGSIAMTQL